MGSLWLCSGECPSQQAVNSVVGHVILEENCQLLQGAVLARFSSVVRASWKLAVSETNVKSFQNTAEMQILFSSRLSRANPFLFGRNVLDTKAFDT